MTEQSQYTATSFESLQAAADEASDMVPGGAEGMKLARIVEQKLEAGGIVGRTQYTITVEASGLGTGSSEDAS